MRILLIEPYYTGSHKVWADGYKKYSKHEIELMTLEGRHWKWRMHGAAIELAQMINERYKSQNPPDLMLISDMIDLTTLKSLLDRSLSAIPIALYFHENQLSYPYTEDDTDSKRIRDFHYGFINYTSALASDKVFFNSKSQMDSFFVALTDLLRRMPDYKGLDTVDALKEKTFVLPLGIEFNDSACDHNSISSNCNNAVHKRIQKDRPTILWTHRWEYDKNPDDFFNSLIELSNEGFSFNLAVLGAKSPKPPKIFTTAKTQLEKHIVAFGKPDTYDEYIGWLKHADILPITSVHETFGISLMEAMHNGVRPLLPNRLSYPELVDPEIYSDFYYKGRHDLVNKLRSFLLEFEPDERADLQLITSKYDWNVMHKIYDDTFRKMT